MLSRRNFFGAAGLTAAGLLSNPPQILRAMPKASSDFGKVKITDVKTAAIKIGYKTHLVKVTTDSGLYGLGEAYPKAEVAQDIHTIKKAIIGEDPLKVEYLHYRLTDGYVSRGSRTGALIGAIGGIETALWDLAGKILNVPVYQLLGGGGYRKKLMLYHDSGSPKTLDPQDWAEEALRSKEYGFKATKFSLGRLSGDKFNGTIPQYDMRTWYNILEGAREALGPDFPLGVDLHWRYTTRDSLRFAQMVEPLNLWFLEDPMRPENPDAYARLTAASKVPILTGENLYGVQGFRPYLEKQACDIIHPDTQKVGGLMEVKKIADLADMYYISMLCHNGSTPVGTIASGHACMNIKSFIALESDSIDMPHWQDIIVRDGPIFKDGYLEISDKPGLGIELNEDVCRANLADDSGFFE